MSNKKKIGALAAAFVAFAFVSPAGANAAPADISVGITNPVTGVSDFETVPSSTTVAELRNIFVGVLGNGVAKHLLTLDGKNLRDSEKIATQGIVDGSQLGVGTAIGGLNVEVYRSNGGNHPTDANF